MSSTPGVQNTVQIGKETTFNTPVAPTIGIIAKYGSGGVTIDKSTQYVQGMKGTAAKNKCSFNGSTKYEGSFDADFYGEFTAHILRSCLGSVATTTVEALIAFKHTFTEAIAKPSYSLQQRIGDYIKRFGGFVVKKVSFDIKPGETVNFKFEGMAASQATQSDNTPAYETRCPLNFAQVTVLTIGGTSILSYARGITIEYDNGLEPFYPLGSTDPQVFFAKQSLASGKLLLRMDTASLAMIDDYIANTKRELIMTVVGSTLGGSSFVTLKITIPQASFKTATTKLDDDINVVDMSFESIEDASNGQIVIELTNSTATL